MRAHPPSVRDQVVPVDGVATLFDEQGEREESLAEAFERFCHDAWTGARPGLKAFSLEMLYVEDASSAASRAGHIRVAA